MYEIHIFVFFRVYLTAALLGSILGSHLATILRARGVIGAAGGSYERLFQEGSQDNGLGGGTREGSIEDYLA